MSKNYFNKYKRNYGHSRNKNLLRLTRTEKIMFSVMKDMTKFIYAIIVALYRVIYNVGKRTRKIIINFYALRKIGYNLDEILDIVYKINPRQFEVFIAELFRQQGFSVHLTPPTKDYGRDVILNDNIFIECKHYAKEGFVGREICQKLLGSVQMFNAEKGIIVTTGKFHRNAYEVARMCDNLELMDICDIQKMILDLKPEQISRVMMRTLNSAG